jgi:hypothetical protein
VANRAGHLNPRNDFSPSAIPLAYMGLAVAILIAFSPALVADFSNWDDSYNIADNPKMNPPTWQSVEFYWSHSAFDLYIPVTYTIWAGLAKISYVPAADTSGWHLNPYVFHTANIVVHFGAALLAFSILRKLIPQSLFAAWAGAMLFALHPVQVESVAWIAGLKDVLAGMFALLTLRLYLEDGSANRQGWCFIFATIALVIAMLCKPIAMIVPLMAAAMDLILARRNKRQIAVRFALWFPLAVACAIVAKLDQPPKYAEVIVSPPMRLLLAGDAIAFYLWKLVCKRVGDTCCVSHLSGADRSGDRAVDRAPAILVGHRRRGDVCHCSAAGAGPGSFRFPAIFHRGGSLPVSADARCCDGGCEPHRGLAWTRNDYDRRGCSHSAGNQNVPANTILERLLFAVQPRGGGESAKLGLAGKSVAGADPERRFDRRKIAGAVGAEDQAGFPGCPGESRIRSVFDRRFVRRNRGRAASGGTQSERL